MSNTYIIEFLNKFPWYGWIVVALIIAIIIAILYSKFRPTPPIV